MRKFLANTLSKVLDKIIGPVLDPLDVTQALSEAITETTNEMTPSPRVVVASSVLVEPSSAQESNWTHCDKSEYYRMIVPSDVTDMNKSQPAYMATIIEDKNTGDVRMVPYLKVPMILQVHATVDPQTKDIDQRQWITPKLDEN